MHMKAHTVETNNKQANFVCLFRVIYIKGRFERDVHWQWQIADDLTQVLYAGGYRARVKSQASASLK